jgi:hypothetical protein
VINTMVDVGASVSVGASVAVLASVGDADAVGKLVSVNVGRETAVCEIPIISAVRASGFVICSERGDEDEGDSLSDDKNEIVRQQITMMPQPETDAAVLFCCFVYFFMQLFSLNNMRLGAASPLGISVLWVYVDKYTGKNGIKKGRRLKNLRRGGSKYILTAPCFVHYRDR